MNSEKILKNEITLPFCYIVEAGKVYYNLAVTAWRLRDSPHFIPPILTHYSIRDQSSSRTLIK